MSELTPEARSLHDAPVSSQAPPSPVRRGSWGLTMPQFFSVMKSFSQREKGWPIGCLAVKQLTPKLGVGLKVNEEGVKGPKRLVMSFCWRLSHLVGYQEEIERGAGTGIGTLFIGLR